MTVEPARTPASGADQLARARLPEPTLPKGGTAVHGLGEKFSVESLTGTASLTVPVVVGDGRGASTAELTLAYHPGAGGSTVGLGWQLGTPSIARKTARGVPTYTDADTFVHGSDDLVPLLVPDGSGGLTPYDEPEVIDGVSHRVQRYLPRTVTDHVRIEQCRDPATGDVFWRTVARDNVTRIFGRTPASRVHDPRDPTATLRVAEWLLDTAHDDRGNVATYEYKPEDTTGVAPCVFEQHRLAPGAPPHAGRYLKHVRYANAVRGDAGSCRIHVVLDYGEHDLAPDEVHDWSVRVDPQSSHRTGFEIRTWRLCRRVMVFHGFGADQGPGPLPRLVRTLELTHQPDPVATTLTSVRQVGYDWTSGAYVSEALPPLAFSYGAGIADTTARAGQLAAVPEGAHIRWVDLDGDGLPGALSGCAGSWWYQAPSGQGVWERPRAVRELPVTARAAGVPQLGDVDGTGRLAASSSGAGLAGTTIRELDGAWSSWRPVLSRPIEDLAQPGSRLQDLDGDGLPDVVLAAPDRIAWRPSLGRDGFGRATVVATAVLEEDGPAPPAADVAHEWFAVDLTGDGLTDLVRVHNGSISYWPNLGHGQFGARVRMADAPVFDHPDQYQPTRLRWADLDGSGTCDLLYLGRDAITRWSNQAGNAWSVGAVVHAMPPVRHLDDVQVIDVLGTGTPALVWTTSDPRGDGVTVRYLDLCASGGRPRLLQSFTNNLGATTSITYSTATSYRLADRAAGNPWTTRLSAPLIVVARTAVTDAVSGSTHTSIYRYRDAYLDPDEREQRGFAMVEARDADHFPLPPPGTASVDQPASRTITWFHLGAHGPTPSGVFTGDPDAVEPATHDVVGAVNGREYREAQRTLAGRPLRIEVYGDDAGPQVPYSVTQHRMRVQRVQATWEGHPGVFRVDPLELVESTYERVADDPRVVHTLTLATDDHGTATSVARVAYARRVPQIPEQSRALVSWTLTNVTNTDDVQTLRLGVVTGTRTFEVTALPVPSSGRHSPEALVTALPALPQSAFEVVPSPVVAQCRLVEAFSFEFWDDAVVVALPAGQIGRRALLRRTRRLAFTPGLLTSVYAGDVDASILTGEGGYELLDGLWWAGDGVLHYDPATFYLPTRWDSEFGNIETVTYDAHHLLVVATRAATSVPLNLNRATIANDYRMLGPRQVVDGNGVTTEVALDPLGRVVASWMQAPDGSGDPPALPGSVHTYGSGDWHAGLGPAWAQTETRERHGAPSSRWQRQRLYTDGLGRVVMTKTQAAAGPAIASDGMGGTMIADTTPEPRYIGTGRTVFSTKGQPVEQYEPYFSATLDYESADALVKHALTQLRAYDPLGRVVRIDHPDGTFERHELGPWQETQSDRNDTVLGSRWLTDRQAVTTSVADARAATLAAVHDSTPTVCLTDALGRVVRTRADNGAAGTCETVLHIGIQGDLRALDDALGRRIETQTYDAMGRVLATASADAGRQAALPACDGHPLRHWGARGHAVRCRYDDLRRPTHLLVREPASVAWTLSEYTVYGETHPQAAQRFLVGRVHRRYDQAGLSQADSHDIGGYLTSGARRVLTLAQPVDWTPLDGQPLAVLDAISSASLTSETFTARSTFDAMGRPLTQELPDGTVLDLTYDAGGLLTDIGGRFAGQGPTVAVVSRVEHDAHLRRTRVDCGSGVTTRYEYDEASSRLAQLTSQRGATTLQDLQFTYDPMGNVMQIDDFAQSSVFFSGAVVSPARTYEYDPIYRLVGAGGREHASLGPQPDSLPPTIRPLPHPNDANALRRYTERYDYDAVGNITALAHAYSGGGWTRRYAYLPGTNRLSAHSLPGDAPSGPFSATFLHDTAGDMTRMPSIATLGWDHAGHLAGVDLGGGGTVTYQHDSMGTRVRQVWQRQGSMREERLYFGAYEVFRRYVGSTLLFERQTVHVFDGKHTVALVETLTVDTQHPGFDDSPILRYQLTDNLGSVGAETDEAGQVISYEEYHPFGTTAVWLARGATAVSTRRYRYSGRENDDGTGLYNCGWRLYAAWLGRWTSPDHAGLTDGANRYAYVDNNPVRLVDPTGMNGDVVDLFAKPSSPFAGMSWGSAAGEQLWLSEAKAFWAEARATDKGRGFTTGLYDYFRDVKAVWGGPESYALGHQGKPFAFLGPGEDSWISIQSVRSNAVQAQVEKGLVGIARDSGIPVRQTGTGLFPGAKGGTVWGQPDVPTITGITPPPPGFVDPVQLPLQFGPPPTGPPPPPPVQLEFNFVPANAAADTSAVTTAVADTGQVATLAPVASDATTLGKVAPVVTDTTAVAPVVSDVTAATTVMTDTSSASKVAPLVNDTAALAKADAQVVSTLEKGADVVKAAAPIVQDVTPVLKEAGALSKIVGTGSKVLKAAQPVIKVAGPVLRVVGEVAKPLGVLMAAGDLATANNNSDRLVASGDLVAGVSMYCGPVGEAFGVGYTVGGLADKGIAYASKAAIGVDLSPSAGIAFELDSTDKLVSAVIPDSPDKPSYKNENKVAWFLIDTLGF